MEEPEAKQATQKTQDKYSQPKLEDLLLRISQFKTDSDPLKIVDDLRNLAEFLVYSEQYNFAYFDILMTTDVLLVDMPKLL
jgi:hypothetical protein